MMRHNVYLIIHSYVQYLCLHFIYLLFLTVLGLHCCVGFSLAGESKGYSLVVAHGLFIAVASPVAAPGL